MRKRGAFVPQRNGPLGKGFSLVLNFLDVRRSRALRAIHDIEGHLLAFRKGFETTVLNRGVMNKDISAFFLLDEPIPL